MFTLKELMPFYKRVQYSAQFDKLRLLFAQNRIQLHYTKKILMACIEHFFSIENIGYFYKCSFF